MWLTTVVNDGGEHCRNCSTPESPIWRVLHGRDGFAEDEPY